ncbi:MAG: hypothetical protein MMC33_006276 [Icmadophila ericetorum]|nr:hypothetical protein [Icmadophila ericetorum]
MKMRPGIRSPLYITPPIMKSNSLLFSPQTIRSQRRLHQTIASKRSRIGKAKITPTKSNTLLPTADKMTFARRPRPSQKTKPYHLHLLEKPLPSHPRPSPRAPPIPIVKIASLSIKQAALEVQLQQHWIFRFNAGHDIHTMAPNSPPSEGMQGREVVTEEDSFAPDYLLKPTVYNPVAERKERERDKAEGYRERGQSKELKVPESIERTYQETALELVMVEMEIELLYWDVWRRGGWRRERMKGNGGGLGRMGTV